MDLLHKWSPLLLEYQWQRNGEGRKMVGEEGFEPIKAIVLRPMPVVDVGAIEVILHDPLLLPLS